LSSITVYTDGSYVWRLGQYTNVDYEDKSGKLPDKLFEQIRATKDKHEGPCWRNAEVYEISIDDTMDPVPQSIENLFSFLDPTRSFLTD
jgi:hypothetical protein